MVLHFRHFNDAAAARRESTFPMRRPSDANRPGGVQFRVGWLRKSGEGAGAERRLEKIIFRTKSKRRGIFAGH